MTEMHAYLWMSFGVLVAIVFPVLRAAVAPKPLAKVIGLPPWVKKYGLLLLFCAVTGIILLAAYLAAKPGALEGLKWFTAFLFGFSWESAIEKITTKPAT
ncbi:MAG TPA: hypothetical protein VGG20_28985 [Thermoanaerobaculia bacterium]|jgi:hypothetical protein